MVNIFRFLGSFFVNQMELVQGLHQSVCCAYNRDVTSHLTYEHRVFNSDDFLKTREQTEQLFYRKVMILLQS